MTRYAELQVTTNFTFLEGGSHPEELARQAAALGLAAIAVTDRNSLAGVVRAHQAAKEAGIPLIVGARLDVTDGPSVLALVPDRESYARLSKLITLGRRRAGKGQCLLTTDDILERLPGARIVVLPQAEDTASFREILQRYRAAFGRDVWLAATHRYAGTDARRLQNLAMLADAAGVPLIATNDILYHHPERRILQDVLTCIRLGTTIDKAGWRLSANAERHLKRPQEMARLFRDHPQAIVETIRLAESCHFSLEELSYEYPDEILRHKTDPQEELEYLAQEGLKERYGNNPPPQVADNVRRELTLIRELKYAPYFLTVHDIVRFAKDKEILCQGRGSAANSAVCYVLGITSVDPSEIDLLFERFLSAERNEPPDIDVDFEHERREEVIQYIYEKYGRHRAALTATVITYRRRSAVRDIGKALGLSLDTIDRLNNNVAGWRRDLSDESVREEGFDPADKRLAATLELAAILKRFPRHLSQHTGGFVISKRPLDEIVPIENAAMEDRTVIEWDKDDLSLLGLVKVDVLALGMLTCIRRAYEFLAEQYDVHHTLASIPADDGKTYEMLGRADTIGVFQVESRAQISMLPRLKPKNFYDIVIEVSIVRPGPIQGDMVHPYLRRRNGEEKVDYPSKALRKVLEKTKGVPLFQEQAMKIAIVAAGFTPAEADGLRRAMATFRHAGTIQTFRDKMIAGMLARGYTQDFAERCFRQIEGFGEYGFPESHAASFALLVYVSAWLKCHYPEVFAAALLNSQPMGFYAPAQIMRDARAHGVEVRPVDINHSNWDSTLEKTEGPYPHAIRLGFSRVKGLHEADMERLMEARGSGYRSPHDLLKRGGLSIFAVERLAEADAFQSLGLDRRQAAWVVRRRDDAGDLPLFARVEAAPALAEPALPAPTMGEHVVADYVTTHMSLKSHPAALLRERLEGAGIIPSHRLAALPSGRHVTVGGIVLARQRPGTAKGVIFITLEDEFGIANLIVFPSRMEAHRRATLAARLMLCKGRLENRHGVIHVIADTIIDISDWLQDLTPRRQTRLAEVIERGRFFR
jgi:error-prone DNA polymerase